MIKQLESKLKEYFFFWEGKDHESISKLLDSKIVLKDWDNLVVGKQAVTNFNMAFFDSVNIIKLDIVSINFHADISFIELQLEIDGNQLIVLDKITFNKKGLITNIRAYKG